MIKPEDAVYDTSEYVVLSKDGRLERARAEGYAEGQRVMRRRAVALLSSKSSEYACAVIKLPITDEKGDVI